jgi:hypothetical protein
MSPKAFISYSWTTQQHQELVKEWADRLLADKIDVILDIYDLKEGHDKNAFMEKMVTDKDITHVLVICDAGYAEKANARKRGVGTESQIISQEVYEQVEQSKFIPIVTEFKMDGNPFIPTFLKSRIWIDFSSPEAVSGNWERLVRLLYGKPLHEKPKLGKIPLFLEETAIPPTPARAKYQSLKQALLSAKPGISMYRKQFLDACIEYADELRIRERPSVDNFGKRVLEDCNKLVPVRDHIVDWVLLEAEIMPSAEFSERLIDLLERLQELKARPHEVNQWSDTWFEAHSLFVFETFLYIVAALVKTGAFDALNEVFYSHYIRPSTEQYSENRFDRFDKFHAYSEALQSVLAPEGRRLYSPAAALLQRQANRVDLPFSDIVQADLIALIMAFITPGVRWYPQLMHYSRHGDQFPFFMRASQHKNFKKLARITGIEDADLLRQKVKEGHERLNVSTWHDFMFERDFWQAMNMDKLDTVR